MKKIMKKIIIILITIVAISCTIIGGLNISYYKIFIEPRITHSDMKKIDLSSINRIEICNDNQKMVIQPNQEMFNDIVSVFKNKRIKVTDKRVYLWYDNQYKISLITNEQTYTLYGVPEIYSDGTISEPIVFVLYDYTNDGVEYLFQIVTISKNDFEMIFYESSNK